MQQGQCTNSKQAVIGMRERGGKVKAMPINHTDQRTLQGKVYEGVMVGSTIYTDKHSGYAGMNGLFYTHQAVRHSAKEYVNGMAHTNGIESV